MEKAQDAGAQMHTADPAARSEAARLMGSITSEKKTAAVRENGKLGGRKPGTPMSEEHKAAIKAARQAQEDARKQAAPVVIVEKKRAGRPRTRPVAEAPTRGRGRPKKQDAQTTAEASGTAGRGTGEVQEA